MNPFIGLILGIAAIHEGAQQVTEGEERWQVYKQARAYADSVGKLLLVVGVPKFDEFNHPGGDVTIDISPDVPTSCDYEIADVRDIPYPDKYFGAAFASHILEHLSTMEDACRALDELDRVADMFFIVSPHKSSIMAWLHPEHRLWITENEDGYRIEQR
ncbi:hypothetical protein ES703_52015 [subsurface metagenome]